MPFGLSLAGFSFGAPYVLAALVVLPVIYFLLRVTPPTPRRIVFPPLRFLLGLQSQEETPARTPWWLLVLRLIAAALIIVAIAQPRFDPTPIAQGVGPLVLFVDNGWPAAADWPARENAISRALGAAERDKRAVMIIATADGNSTPQLLDASAAQKASNDLTPKPWLPDRKRALARLNQARFTARPQILWLSDGIDHDDAKPIAQELNRIGALSLYADPASRAPLALRPPGSATGGFEISIERVPNDQARGGMVAALDARNQIIEQMPFRFDAGRAEAKATIVLPLELRNQAARIAVLGMQTAGSVQLLDARFRRRAVGVVSGGSADVDQPLLSDTFYLERALQPYAEIRKGTIGQVLDSGVAVLALADIGQLTSAENAAILKFVDEGGVLLRFAGPRLAARAASDNADDLEPVRLRAGARVLGSALTWAEPQHLAAFPTELPFAGLIAPDDVTVSRQVLAEPTVDLAEHSWARLTDGTPLVTGAPHGKGWIVLFHVAASPGWSTLPISGLYVEMLRRVAALSDAGRTGARASGSIPLPPYRSLDAYGRLASALPEAQPLKPEEIDTVTPGPDHPPGLYGNEGAFLALNAVAAKAILRPLNIGIPLAAYSGAAARDLEWPLLTAGLILLLIDAAVSLWLRGYAPVVARNAIAGLAIALVFLPHLDARADDVKDMEAALATRLAFVVTGAADVDEMSRAGLVGLAQALKERTAYEPEAPIAVDIEKADLSLYPLLYWPMTTSEKDLSPQAVAKVDAYMRNGGTILFDTRDAPMSALGGVATPGEATLRRLLARLDIPPLEPVPQDHVLTKSFYLLRDFPGRWSGGQVWVEALPPADPNSERVPARGGDGVSPVIIGGNDWASAWARDDSGRAIAAVVPGGENQREMATRFGINVVMYALTGNYKTDQVHAPALLERLGE